MDYLPCSCGFHHVRRDVAVVERRERRYVWHPVCHSFVTAIRAARG